MSRNRHGFDELMHFGQLGLSRIVLGEGIDTAPAGTPVEDVLRALYEHVEALENAEHQVLNFTASARLSPIFYADAEIYTQPFYEDNFNRTASGGWGTSTDPSTIFDPEYGHFSWYPYKFSSSSQHGSTVAEIAARMAVARTSFFRDEDTGGIYLQQRPYYVYTSTPNQVLNVEIEGAGFPALKTGTFIFDFYHIASRPSSLHVVFQSPAYSAGGYVDITWNSVINADDHYEYVITSNSGLNSLTAQVRSAVFDVPGLGDYGLGVEIEPTEVVRVKGEFAAPGGTNRLKYWKPWHEDEPGWMASSTQVAAATAYDHAPSLYILYSTFWNTSLFPTREVGGPSLLRVYSGDTDWAVYRQFSVDAVVTRAMPIYADAVLKKTASGSFTIDAALYGNSIFINAVLFKNISSSYAVDAAMSIPASGSFTVDAVTSALLIRIDAIVKRIWGATPTIDAVIVTEEEEEDESSSSPGELVLGEAGLGD